MITVTVRNSRPAPASPPPSTDARCGPTTCVTTPRALLGIPQRCTGGTAVTAVEAIKGGAGATEARTVRGEPPAGSTSMMKYPTSSPEREGAKEHQTVDPRAGAGSQRPGRCSGASPPGATIVAGALWDTRQRTPHAQQVTASGGLDARQARHCIEPHPPYAVPWSRLTLPCRRTLPRSSTPPPSDEPRNVIPTDSTLGTGRAVALLRQVLAQTDALAELACLSRASPSIWRTRSR